MYNIFSNYLEIDFYGNGLNDEPSKAQIISFGVVGLLLILLGAMFIWWFFSAKAAKKESKASVADLPPWSFKGFWGRYKTEVLLFLLTISLLIGLALLAASISGTPSNPFDNY